MNKNTLITNAKMVNEGKITEGDLLINDGRVNLTIKGQRLSFN